MAPFVSDSEMSDSETEASHRNAPNRGERAATRHHVIPAYPYYVVIILKDAHDSTGPGMKLRVRCTNIFKNIFDHFKARSCSNCRAAGEMRFKTATSLVSERDTPDSVRNFSHPCWSIALANIFIQLGLKQATTTEIKVWSNVPGLQCEKCQSTGYPKTEGPKYTYQLSTPSLRAASNKLKPETIALHVRDQTGFETSVKTLNTVGLRYLMEQYAASALRDVRFCRFLFDGERLVESETPKKVGLLGPRMCLCVSTLTGVADGYDQWRSR